MRCLFICTADSYDIPALYALLKERCDTQLDRDVIHVKIENDGHIFYFSYGCTVCWGLTKEQEKAFIAESDSTANFPLKEPVTDIFSYSRGETSKIVNGEIVLANTSSLTLFAISHGLAQSVKLDAFENRIQKTVDDTKHIPEQMAQLGRVGLSHNEIRRKMGQLFIERNSINLHFDILDKPDFFWEYPEVEPLYTMIATYLDIETRVEVLNQRLGVIHELFDMLNNELNHKHSSRLEWTIIILILIEVAISFLKDVLHVIA